MLMDYAVEVDPIGSQFRLTWKRAGQLLAPPYQVNRNSLKQIVNDQVRPRLSDLTALATTNKLADSGETLHDLAKAGWELYKVFFTPEGKGGSPKAKAVETAVKSASAGATFCVFVKERVYIPWGLLYDAEPPDGASADFEVYREHFWCLRYRLATVYDPQVSDDDLSPEFDASDFDMIVGMDSTLSDEIAKCACCQPEMAVFEELRKQHGDHVHSANSDAWLAAWRAHEGKLGLLYFYGHSDQTTLSFGAGANVKFSDFGYDYRKATYPPLCLVFLNGCHTAEGHEAGGFLEVTSGDGFCGFVGTEAPVPRIFAFRFAVALKALLYQGKTLVEIMEHLRKMHWPLGLLYGLYAFPLLKLKPKANLALPPLGAGNYSDNDLGNAL
jgi:hypothetical protein